MVYLLCLPFGLLEFFFNNCSVNFTVAHTGIYIISGVLATNGDAGMLCIANNVDSGITADLVLIFLQHVSCFSSTKNISINNIVFESSRET